MSQKKKMLSIKEKMEVLNVVDKENLSVRALAKRFNIGKTQAATLVKQKEDIKRIWMGGDNVNKKKKFLNADGSKIDHLSFEWFVKARSQNIPISGIIIKEKAKEIAGRLGIQNFSASNGWLEKWRRRHNVTFKRICGESSEVNFEDVQQFKQKLPNILLGYSPKDIYNADETGLFFSALPNKTLALKNEKCVGGKLSKERLTVLLCANMVGDKGKPLVIGKAACPRAFKRGNIGSLPVEWKSNRKAWMSREIMCEWLEMLDKKMGCQKRKILLFLDNATTHPRDIKLDNIKLIFLPANTTSVCQPLDQGIIQNFKCHYRCHIIKHILTKLGDIPMDRLSKTFDILEAVFFIKSSWDNVTAETIKNCFSKAGFQKAPLECSDFEAEDHIPISTLAALIKILNENQQGQYTEEFLLIDEVVNTEDNNIDVVIDEINTEELSDGESEDSNHVCVQDECQIKSYPEALEQLRRIKQFLRDDITGFQYAKTLECHLENLFLKHKQENLRQTTVYEFVKPKI